MRWSRINTTEIQKRLCCLVCMLSTFYAATLYAAGFADVEQKIREHVLSNGMKFIILERHEAPVFSGYIYVNVGSVDEVYGNTGNCPCL